MRSGLLVMACLSGGLAGAQSKLTIGEYAYAGANQPLYISSVIQYQGKQHWYAEARYNYEDYRTCSLYGGYTFSGDHKLSYSVTPMIGWMAGRLKGGSAGLNAEFDYKRIYFSIQSQYCASSDDRGENFFFSWSEAGYHVCSWLYTGLSLQYTLPYRGPALPEPGVFASFSFRQWSFSVYSFLPARQPMLFVLGVSREWKYRKKSSAGPGKPPLPAKNRGIIF